MNAGVLRLGFAFLLAPIAAASAGGLTFVLGGVAGFISTPSSALQTALGFGQYILVVSYAATIFVAAPMIAVFSHHYALTRWRVVAIGAAIGAFPFVVFFGYGVAWELLRAFMVGTALPHSPIGLQGTVERLLRDVPRASVWLAAGIASGSTAALLFSVIAPRDLWDEQ